MFSVFIEITRVQILAFYFSGGSVHGLLRDRFFSYLQSFTFSEFRNFQHFSKYVALLTFSNLWMGEVTVGGKLRMNEDMDGQIRKLDQAK